MTTLPPAVAVRKRDVRPTDANVARQISTALTCVNAAKVDIFVRRAIVQMMILKKTRMLCMRVTTRIDRTMFFCFFVLFLFFFCFFLFFFLFSLEQRLSSDLSDLVILILNLFTLE